MRHYHIAATARASFCLYNDEDDLAGISQALHRAQEVFAIG